MPVSIARKIEHILRRDGHDDLDIRLDPLVLTASQVSRYGLPRIPIKDSDQRKGHFEARFGAGATELDALEAIRPGELARIIEERVEVYRSPTRETPGRDRDRHPKNLNAKPYRLGKPFSMSGPPRLLHIRSEFERMQQAIRPHCTRWPRWPPNTKPAWPGTSRGDQCRGRAVLRPKPSRCSPDTSPSPLTSKPTSLIPMTYPNGRPAMMPTKPDEQLFQLFGARLRSSKSVSTRPTKASPRAGALAGTAGARHDQPP